MDMIEFIVEHCQAEDYLPRNYVEYILNHVLLGNICIFISYSYSFLKYIRSRGVPQYDQESSTWKERSPSGKEESLHQYR